MEEKKPMCLSREEQDSLRALAGTAEETVELSHSLYQAVVQTKTPIPVIENLEVAAAAAAAPAPMPEESPTRRALKTAPIPRFEDEDKH